MSNSERKRVREELFKRQQEELAKQRIIQRQNFKGEAYVEVGKTPGGPRFKGPNQHQKYAESGINLFGLFGEIEHYRNGKLIAVHEAPNLVVNEGLNATLNIMFDSGTQITTWYALLIDITGFAAIAATDTYDDINQVGNGWDEFSSYTDANNASSAVTRPVWPPDPASAQSITNSTTKAIYDITAGGTVKGIGVVGGGANSSDKNDHASDGSLLSASTFTGGDVVVVNGDQLKVTYTMNAANP